MPPAEVRAFRNSKDDCPFVEWLRTIRRSEPKVYSKCLYLLQVLASEGAAIRRPLGDYLRNGIRELRAEVGNVEYRLLYSFVGSQVAVVSHAITKESEVPDSEINLAIKRIALANKNPDKHTTPITQADLLK